MNSQGCICVVIVLANCLLVTLASSIASPDEVYGNEVAASSSSSASSQIAYLEQKLREDLVREERDLLELERQLAATKNLISAKKRQLEIRKRRPYECLVNIISCWK